jgi:hypothetical protein
MRLELGNGEQRRVSPACTEFDFAASVSGFVRGTDMKPRDSLLRLKQFEADEKARKVSDLEMMIRDFETMASDLDRQIRAEEDRTGVKDVAHFAYSTFAKSAAARRDNLRASANELKAKLEAAMRERDEAQAKLTHAPATETRDQGRRRPDRSHGAAMRH